MNRRVALLVALILVALGIGFWLARTPAGPRGVASSSGTPLDGTARDAGRRRAPIFARPRRIELGSAEVRRELDDDRLGTLTGRVVSSGDGRPVARASLEWLGPDGAHGVTTNADGAFELVPSVAGDYELALARADGFLPFAPELGESPIRFQARRSVGLAGVTIRLAPAVDYLGLVVAPSGDPVAGATVSVIESGDDQTSSGTSSSEHVTDAKGSFRFTAADGALLEARHRDFAPGRARVDFSAQVSHRLKIVLGKPGPEQNRPIVGAVLDEAGAPQADVAVVARAEAENPAKEAPELERGGQARTDQNGRFEITGLTGSLYGVYAGDGARAPAVVHSVSPSGPPVTLVLTVGGALSGRVTSAADGRPVVAFTVIVSEPRGPLTSDVVSASSSFDPDGRYRVAPLRSGKYSVRVAAAGFATSAAQEVVLEREATADFVLTRGATLAGVVRGAKDDAPIEGAKVTVEGALGSGSSTLALAASVVTNDAGRFELGGVSPGLGSLLVAAAGHHGRLVSFTVVAGQPPPPLDIALTPAEQGEEPRIELVGIGAVLSARDDVLVIGKVIPGGGAAEVGLAPGDAIVAVDGVNVVALGFDGSIQRIRGPEDTRVSLLVRRGEAGAPVVVSVPRRRIQG